MAAFTKGTPVYFSQDWYQCVGVSISDDCMLVQNYTMGLTETYDACVIPPNARVMRKHEVKLALDGGFFKALKMGAPKGVSVKAKDLLGRAV